MNKCKHCGHILLKHINPKNNKITYLHYNRQYFGNLAINHKHCSMCEVIMNTQKKFVAKDICNKPQPINEKWNK